MKKIISIVLSAFILSLSVFGAAGEEKVSLSLKYAADDLSMDNVCFSIWKIAEIDTDGKTVAAEPFDVEELSEKTPEQLAELSNSLKDLAEKNNIAPYDTATTDKNGRLTFEKINSTGVYFAIGESKMIDEYLYTPTPFVIFLPYTDEYGRVVYDVEAEVKFDKSAVPPTQPVTEPATTTTSPNTPEKNIPQTGTLLWLVPVLFAAGAVLAAAGIIIRKKISK